MKSADAIKSIVKRDGTLVRYRRARVETAIFKATRAIGAPDRAMARAMAVRVEEALASTYCDDTAPSVEDIQDVVENVLMANQHIDVARDYIIYRHQRAMARAARAYAFEVTDNVPYKKIYEVLRWNRDHHCDSVADLNRIIARKEMPALIQATDRRYTAEAHAAAVRILERIANIRIVIIAGPSSSGKTTTMIKVGEKLAAAGVHVKAMNIDHYFFNLEQHPRDEFGDYDYETPQALDLELINTHLAQLMEGQTVRTPDYDFKTGRRTLDVHPFTLDKGELLLIDSLHGLYDNMSSSVADEHKFKIYIETLGQFSGEDGTFMRWADNRLLRRMIRDKQFRNLQPMETLTHWHYVRRSELRNIIPFIKNADCIINSALPYELPFLKQRLFRYISASISRFDDDPRRLDAHIRANRVYDLLKPLRGIRDDSPVPGHSLLREFIGGSTYGY
ncbi:MAG: response regulator SirA [Lentisphaerae bacterium]|nr:response regulator SirA [Lentisphaerota bacterium]